MYAFSALCAFVCVCMASPTPQPPQNTLAKAQFNLFSPLLPVINYISDNWLEFENFGGVRQVLVFSIYAPQINFIKKSVTATGPE